MSPRDTMDEPDPTRPATPDSGELVAGTRLGRYEILRGLARGGMAEVYLARQLGVAGYEKIVALKRVRPHLADDPTFLEMFFAEARLAASLDHSNIAHVLDFGSEDGEQFLALEYIHGRSVAQIVRALGGSTPLPLDVALTIVSETASALHYAHQRCDRHGAPLGLVHRDVSPSNVMVSFEGDVKLVDFGIAKATASDEHTQSTLLKGKVRYMSPEQVQGLPLDRRSDVFALGVVCYELTTGRRCFDAPGEFALLNRVADARYKPPSAVVPDYPAELEAIVGRALAASPEDRYPSARQMQRALTDFAGTCGLRISRLRLVDYLESLYGTVPYPTVDERPTTQPGADDEPTPPTRRTAGSLGALLVGIAGGAAILWMVAGALEAPPAVGEPTPPPVRVDAKSLPTPPPPSGRRNDEPPRTPAPVSKPVQVDEPTPTERHAPAAAKTKASRPRSRSKAKSPRPKPPPAAEPKEYLPPSQQPR